MPVSHDEIAELEDLGDRAWPPAEVLPHDGWLLRATGPGIGRRVNSVAALTRGDLPWADKVAFAEDFYRSRGLAPIFKLTDASPAGLDDLLAGLGYRVDAPVSVRTRPLPADPPAAAVRRDGHPTDDWLAVNAAAGEHYRAAPALLCELIERIRARLVFATVKDRGRPAAVGMAVTEGGRVGLFEIGTHPQHRRRGLARQVVAALLGWGAEHGATGAYLQVMPQNTPALALYRSLGFGEAYRYWYRVAPASVAGAGGAAGR